MKASLADLTVNVDAGTASRIIEDWLWLVGADKKVILVTVIGDLFLKGGDQSIYWLDVGGGKLEKWQVILRTSRAN